MSSFCPHHVPKAASHLTFGGLKQHQLLIFDFQRSESKTNPQRRKPTSFWRFTRTIPSWPLQGLQVLWISCHLATWPQTLPYGPPPLPHEFLRATVITSTFHLEFPPLKQGAGWEVHKCARSFQTLPEDKSWIFNNKEHSKISPVSGKACLPANNLRLRSEGGADPRRD